MNRLRALAWPSYITALLFVTFPLVDTFLTVFPVRLAEVSWRFGAAGLFSRALLTPMLGWFLIFTIALLLEYRRTLQLFSALSALAVVVLIGAMVLFVLDAVQMRSQINPEIKTSFDIAALVALGKYGATVVALSVLALVGWRVSAKDRKLSRASDKKEVLISRVPSPVSKRAVSAAVSPNSEVNPM